MTRFTTKVYADGTIRVINETGVSVAFPSSMDEAEQIAAQMNRDAPVNPIYAAQSRMAHPSYGRSDPDTNVNWPGGGRKD